MDSRQVGGSVCVYVYHPPPSVCVQPLNPIWNTVDAPHPSQLPVGEHDDATTTTTGVIVAMEKTGFESGERQEGILLSSSPLADYVVAAAGPARVCRSPRSPGRYCRERSLPGTKSHPSRGSVIANRQGARPHGICPELHAAAASHWKLPVARELLVTRELPSSCVVTNVAGTGTRGRKGDDAGYDVHRALAPSLG